MRVIFLALLAAAAFAEEPAGHHCRGAVPFEEASRRPPSLMRGIGSSHFPITTSSAEAQRMFDQGIDLLHSFWDFEAYRAFREASRLDPEAAMPHWGMFTALGFNAKEMGAERAEALERARVLALRASEPEQAWIRAAALLVEPGKGRGAWIAEMEALIDRWPEDLDAKLFLANALSTPPSSYAPDGRPREGKLYGQAILRNLLATHPGSAAVHHYWIHAVENGPRPEEGLESARVLPELAPRSGHLLHMAGHIHYRLGRYAEARQAFLRSMEADREYMEREDVSPVANWNWTHNLDYLVGNCAEDGRYEEGLRWAKELERVRLDATRMTARGSGYLLFGGWSARARLQMRYGKWDEAVTSLDESIAAFPESGSLALQYLRGVRAFAVGMAAALEGNPAAASELLEELGKIAAQLRESRPDLGGDWYAGHATKILDVHALELRGVVEAQSGLTADAVATLGNAIQAERELGYWEPPHYARPIAETLATVQLEAGELAEAEASWLRALERRPHSGHALLGLTRTRIRAGDSAGAAEARRRLLEAWRDADPALHAAASETTAVASLTP